jgi:pimeloyl-ACP methyl ester carboxylesterase
MKAEINNTLLYYEVAGFGESIIFLHGFTLDTRMWDEQFQYFAKEYQVVRYDLRGFGKSPVPTEKPFAPIDDLKALLDYLQIKKAHFVGLSMGGAVAIDFTLTYPQYVKSLILLDTVLGGFDWSAEGSARDALVWQEAERGGIAAAKESWRTHPLFIPAFQNKKSAAPLTQIVDDYSGWHFINHAQQINLNPPAAKRLKEIQAPTLAIVGELDLPDFINITEFISKTVSNVKKVSIANTGHMSNMEAADEVNNRIETFLNSL